MTLVQAIILGVVEGVTEFLPISSTGHLILASRLLGLSQTDFQKSFEIAIQLGKTIVVTDQGRTFVAVDFEDRRMIARRVVTQIELGFRPAISGAKSLVIPIDDLPLV